MNDQPEPPPESEPIPPGEPAPQPLPKIVWLFEAFIPSVLALGIMQSATVAPGLGIALLILTVVCSLVAAIGVVRGMESKAEQIVLAIFLTGVFFIANLVVVVLIGCSHMAI
jgi:hypothetical protein